MKLTPKFFFINACIPVIYKDNEKYFLHLLQKLKLITV
ncbi:hypothetical protein D1AOALGA4SA_9206 [Olavius algarvensis Delta 1 endosymbiont]|nr:hypothetical protein D1AOALGA4SA_9206 [Olavius algarvensis Delta 1 endosymbiont]